MDEVKVYEGCPPGWKPDEWLASENRAPKLRVSIADQAKAAREQWRLDPLNPGNELPEDRKLPAEPEPEEEPADDADDEIEDEDHDG